MRSSVESSRVPINDTVFGTGGCSSMEGFFHQIAVLDRLKDKAGKRPNIAASSIGNTVAAVRITADRTCHAE
jgi:hypothetical protein